jgi:hypothetical protein
MQTKRPQPLSANDGGASVIPHIARAASEQYGCKKSFASTAPSQIRAVFLNRENRPMISAKKISIAAVTFVLARAVGLPAQATTAADTPLVTLAQAMVPPTGMMDAEHPMPTKERMLKRFPQRCASATSSGYRYSTRMPRHWAMSGKSCARRRATSS